ncbi:phage exclusion protein Lit family protein [Shewanella algae]
MNSFLCALAWILHHEIAHVYHAHPNIAGSNEESREQEKRQMLPQLTGL